MPFAIADFGIELGRPRPPVPDHDRAGPIFALRDDTFEVTILERVIFDMDGKPLFARDEARTFRHGPALQDAIELEAEVVMKPAGGMLLDYIGIATFSRTLLAGRLRCLGEIPLRPVGFQ